MKSFVPIGVAFLFSCATVPEQKENVPAPVPPPPIGRTLTEIDLLLRTWNAKLLETPSEESIRLTEAAENSVRKAVAERFDEIAAQIDSGSPRNRVIAAACLGFVKEERALPYLVRALGDDSPEMVANSLMSLGVLGSDATPLEPILEALVHHPATAVRNQAAFALVRLCSDSAQAPDLTARLRQALRDPEPGVRAQAAAALGKIRDSNSLETLLPLLQDSKPLVAAAASFALGRIGDPRAIGALTQAMESRSPRVREAAHQALVAIAGEDRGSRSWDWKGLAPSPK